MAQPISLKPSCPECGDNSKVGLRHDSGRGRFFCNSCQKRFVAGKAADVADAPVKALAGRKFVITSAVSDSPVHKGFFATLQHYCKVNGAQLIVIPLPYRNPTSRTEDPANTFASEVVPYLTTRRTELGHRLQILADVPVQPTASRPLTGLENFGGEKSAILGHPKVAYKTVATRLGKLPKVVLSTGACTQPRYSASKAGRRGEFHHIYAAAVVELTANAFHVRHVHGAKGDGSFHDLNHKYSGVKVTAANISVLTLGDLHASRVDADALTAVRDMIKTLKPRTLVLHDVLDFESGSHHNSWLDKVRLRAQNRDNVSNEFDTTVAVADSLAAIVKEVVVVHSNHDRHVESWLLRQNDNIDNEEVYLSTKLAAVRALKAGKSFNAFKYAFEQRTKLKSKYTWLTGNTAHVIAGIDYSMHGDRGPNGARGSRAAFLGTGNKSVLGHAHSPGIDDGVYQVGTTSKLNLGYNAGSLSSWLHCHCVTYASGRRTLLASIGTEWHGR